MTLTSSCASSPNPELGSLRDKILRALPDGGIPAGSPEDAPAEDMAKAGPRGTGLGRAQARSRRTATTAMTAAVAKWTP